MSWRNELISLDNMKRAYFRGVPFYIKSSELEVGRRTRLYEYWDDENTRVADFGYKADIFNLEGYIIQSAENAFNYFENRNALIQAFKKLDIDRKGEVAELIHPYYGRRNVQIIEPARFREIEEEGGICRFTVSLAEQGKAAIKGGTPDLVEEMDGISSLVNSQVSDNFVQNFQKGSLALQNTLDTGTAMLSQIQGGIYSVRNTISSTISSSVGIAAAAINTLGAVVNEPCQLYNTMRSGIDSMKGLVGMADEVITGGIIGECSGITRGEIITLDGSSIPRDLGVSVIDTYIQSSGTSNLNVVFGDNTNAMNDIFSAQTALTMTEIAIRIDFESVSDLINTREAITTTIDLMALDSTDPVIIQQLELLRAEYARISIQKISDLGREITYELPPDAQSTIVIAYQQYNDLSRSDEIAKRNNVAHPGFIQDRAITILDE